MRVIIILLGCVTSLLAAEGNVQELVKQARLGLLHSVDRACLVVAHQRDIADASFAEQTLRGQLVDQIRIVETGPVMLCLTTRFHPTDNGVFFIGHVNLTLMRALTSPEGRQGMAIVWSRDRVFMTTADEIRTTAISGYVAELAGDLAKDCAEAKRL